MYPSERPANQPIIELVTNSDPNLLHLDFPQDENITSLLEALAEDAYDVDKDITPAGKKRTLAKDACNADKDVTPARKKKTQRKVILLSNKDLVPAGKKKTQGRGKVRLRKKMRTREKRKYIKKTPSVVGSETHKRKLDSDKGLDSEVSNADIVIRPASRLSNTDSKTESGFDNGEAKKSGNKLIVMMCNTLISLLRVSPCLSTSSEIVNAVILKLPNIHSSVDFKTIS